MFSFGGPHASETNTGLRETVATSDYRGNRYSWFLGRHCRGTVVELACGNLVGIKWRQEGLARQSKAQGACSFHVWASSELCGFPTAIASCCDLLFVPHVSFVPSLRV